MDYPTAYFQQPYRPPVCGSCEREIVAGFVRDGTTEVWCTSCIATAAEAVDQARIDRRLADLTPTPTTVAFLVHFNFHEQLVESCGWCR